jgi:uncharacterized metal-binding protein YceD (DUF177 family)
LTGFELTGLKKYKIDMFNLPSGEHEYEFTFDSDFFNNFENTLVEKGYGIVKVNLEKSETFLEMSMEIEGSLELVCDRSLEPFYYPIKLQKNLILKFGEEEEDLDGDEIIFIPWNTQTIQLEQYIYEFLSLEVPIKKLHPRYLNEDSSEEEILIYSSSMESDNKEKEEDVIDPRWQKLKNLEDDNKKTSK